MAKVEIRHKCITVARDAARRESQSRVTGKSLFVKRCYGTYRIILVDVSKEQRACRDIFADAQRLASREMKSWNKKRHWAREAKRHKVKGAHRMAVSYFYKQLKENGGRVEIVVEKENRRKMVLMRCGREEGVGEVCRDRLIGVVVDVGGEMKKAG